MPAVRGGGKGTGVSCADDMKESNYTEYYNRITAPLRGKDRAVHALNLANRILTAIVYATYALLLIGCLAAGAREGGLTGAVRGVLPYVLIPGVSFVVLSVVRGRIDEKRPYETWDIEQLIPKKTKGHSMPSRHIFSTTIIAMCVLTRSFPLGVLYLLMSAFFAWIRVIGGVHYPRDVLAGYLTGVLCGLLLFV